MSETEFIPYKRLASIIILTAVEDYKKGKLVDVTEFIESNWFDVLSGVAGIDPAHARGKLLTGNLVEARLVRGEVVHVLEKFYKITCQKRKAFQDPLGLADNIYSEDKLTTLNQLIKSLATLINHILGENKVSKETQKAILYILVTLFVVLTVMITDAILYKWMRI